MKVITLNMVEEITFALAREKLSFSQPIPDFHTRPPNALESCLGAPFQSFAGKELYPATIGKISILFYLMNKNHPFYNGNKRIATTTLLYALSTEGKWLSTSWRDLYEFAVVVAGSPPQAKKQIEKYIVYFLKSHITSK